MYLTFPSKSIGLGSGSDYTTVTVNTIGVSVLLPVKPLPLRWSVHRRTMTGHPMCLTGNSRDTAVMDPYQEFFFLDQGSSAVLISISKCNTCKMHSEVFRTTNLSAFWHVTVLRCFQMVIGIFSH